MPRVRLSDWVSPSHAVAYRLIVRAGESGDSNLTDHEALHAWHRPGGTRDDPRAAGLDGVAAVKRALGGREPALVGVVDPVWLLGSL